VHFENVDDHSNKNNNNNNNAMFNGNAAKFGKMNSTTTSNIRKFTQGMD
jgi:hypothetical protein